MLLYNYCVIKTELDLIFLIISSFFFFFNNVSELFCFLFLVEIQTSKNLLVSNCILVMLHDFIVAG